jgi:ketosteroid isomerase-like protein
VEQYLDVVRGIYERWGRGDFSAGTELYDPHVLLVLRTGFPEAGAYRGLDAIRRYMTKDFLADFADPAIAGEEFLAATASSCEFARAPPVLEAGLPSR